MTVSSRCICTAIDAKVLAKIIERQHIWPYAVCETPVFITDNQA